ncbi:MAG: hypothetical protein RML93_10125 [Anaerolineales bacterium]|nr:hypothetical protein [Anaerolineales bacterium]MDW8447632.1 hypothetical protein [Anaerolineales bacterium]
MSYLASFFTALSASILALALLIRLLHRLKIAVQPREDRWHRIPTPKFGGVGIFAATALGFLVAYFSYPEQREPLPLTLFAGVVLIFGFGLLDDVKPMTPMGKLIAQLVAASVAVFFGYTTDFFLPRFGDTPVARLLNSGVTIVWLVSITNAMNLLDNMDGLAGGISLIACSVLGYFFWESGEVVLLLLCLALGGALLGFLFFNFPPAKIFMGDSGSQFLGFTLALLAVARQPQASNVFAIIAVPTLVFTLPLAEAIFVTITRWSRGESPFKGGRDHTSHRLIAFGLTERQALWVLYSIALAGGITAIVVESLNYTLSLILLPIIVVSLLIFTTYLAGVKITGDEGETQKGNVRKVLIHWISGRSLLEVFLDSVLISFSFYLAVIFGVPISQADQIRFFIQTLPLALISGYVAFFFTQIYRDVRSYLQVENIYRYVQAALWAGFFLWLLRFFVAADQGITPAAVLIFGVTLFGGLMITKFSFQALDTLSTRSRTSKAERVLLYASADSLRYLLPYLMSEKNGTVQLVGLITDQEAWIGKRIYNLRVLGKIEQLGDLIRNHRIQGVIVEEGKASQPKLRQILDISVRSRPCWVRVITLSVVDYDQYLGS